jgi:hypothetical protein
MGGLAGIGDLAGGVVGGIISAGDRKRARGEYDQAVGDLMDSNPEAGRTEYDRIHEDPALRSAEMSALQGFQQEANAGGLTVQDRAALQQAQDANAQRERGAREAILQNMAMRGMGGSGSELAAALENQQGSAMRNNAAGTQAAADARNRALQAMATSGQMAGGIRSQDWQQAAQRAASQDAINKFNASQRLSRAGQVANVRLGKGALYNQEAGANMGMARGIGSGVGAIGDYGEYVGDKPINQLSQLGGSMGSSGGGGGGGLMALGSMFAAA